MGASSYEREEAPKGAWIKAPGSRLQRVSGRREKALISRIAKDFGASESCVQGWLTIADVEGGVKPGVTQADAVELREARNRIRLLDQEDEILRRAAAYLPQEPLPQ